MIVNKSYLDTLVQRYVGLGNIYEAKEEIIDYTKEAIGEFLDNLYEDDLYDLIHDYFDDNLHKMCDLDDTFEYLTVTEVLENLRDIDTADEYFHADSAKSSNDPWELIDLYQDTAIKALFEKDVDYESEDLDDIFEEYEYLMAKVTDAYKIYDKAKELFDKALKEDPQELVNVLWTMKQDQ